MLGLLSECKRWTRADTMSYSAATSAYEKGDQWQHALVLLRTMFDERIWPDTSIYNAVISTRSKDRCWESALALLSESKSWTAPDTISYNATVSAGE